MEAQYEAQVWMADGNPIIMDELGKMRMFDYYALFNKKLKDAKRLNDPKRKWQTNNKQY